MAPMRTAMAGVVSMLGGGAGALLGLVLTVVVGRWLGGADAGYFFQLVALFMIVANVLELGADTGLVRQLSRLVSLHRFADLRKTVAVAVVPVVVLGAVVAGLLVLFAPALANLLGGADGGSTVATLTTLIIHAAPFVLPAALVTVLLGGTRGLGSVVPYTSVYNVGIPMARVLGVGTALLAGFGLLVASRAWAWAFVPAAVAAAVVLIRQLRRSPTAARHDPPATPAGTLAREFWGFSAPRGAAAGVEIALSWLDVLIVGALLGPTAAGIYAVAVRCAQSGLIVENAMRMAVSPKISAALATNDTASARRLHLGATRTMIMLAWPVFVTLALFGPAVLPLFGDGFAAGAGTLAVLCLAMLVLTGAGMVQTVLLMSGRSRWQLGNKSVALAVNVVANLALIPLLGVPGAALAWLLTLATDAGMATWEVHRAVGVRVGLAELLPPVALVAATVVVPGVIIRFALGARPVGLGIDIAVCAVLLVAVGWYFRRSLGVDEALRSTRARLRSRTT